MDKETQDLQKEVSDQSAKHGSTEEVENECDQKDIASETAEHVKTKDFETESHRKDANREVVGHTMTKDAETFPFSTKEDLEKSEADAVGKPWSHYLKGAIFVLSGALIQIGIIYVLYHHVFGLPLDFFRGRHPIQQDSVATFTHPDIIFGSITRRVFTTVHGRKGHILCQAT
jgi:hypothetical protein